MYRIASGIVVLGLVLSGVPDMARSDALKDRERRAMFASKTKVLDTRASVQYNNSVSLQPPKVNTPGKFSKTYTGKYRGEYLQMAQDAARRHRIPEDLFARLVQQESGWNPRAQSHKGALGLAQLMPHTAAALGVDPADPYQNLDGGARYLARQFREFGTWKLALAAYNAGPQAVRKHGGVPPYQETRNYVVVIAGN